MTARNNPWLGLKSYEEDDWIYGRNKETEDLTNVIINSFNTASRILVYAKKSIRSWAIIALLYGTLNTETAQVNNEH